jgi:hypothetical protein
MTTEFISLIFTRWASRRLSYAALLRVRSKNYDVTLRRLAYESLRLVQNPGINPQKLKSGGKYRQEFYILRLFVIRALTYKVEGLIIYLDEKGINFHIVSGHIRSNDALIGSISF